MHFFAYSLDLYFLFDEYSTLSDTGFFEVQNMEGGELFGHPILTLPQEQQSNRDVQTWAVVSPNLVGLIKLFRTVNRPRPLDL